MADTPEMQSQLVSAHGMLAILEVLEGRSSRDVTMKLLQIVNAVWFIYRCPPFILMITQARDDGYGFPRKLLSHWVRMFLRDLGPCELTAPQRDPSDHGLYVEEVPSRVSNGGVELHTSPLPFLRFDSANVYCVSGATSSLLHGCSPAL